MRKTVIDKVICKVDVVNQYRVVACWTYGCPGVTMSFAKLVAPLFTWWKKKKKKKQAVGWRRVLGRVWDRKRVAVRSLSQLIRATRI